MAHIFPDDVVSAGLTACVSMLQVGDMAKVSASAGN